MSTPSSPPPPAPSEPEKFPEFQEAVDNATRDRALLAEVPQVAPRAARPHYGTATPGMAMVDVSHLKAVKAELLELWPKPDWPTFLRDVCALALVAYKILCDGKPWHPPGSGLETWILVVLAANVALALAKANKARKAKNSTLVALALVEDGIVQPNDGKPVPEWWKFLSRRPSNWRRLSDALWARVLRWVELPPATEVRSLPAVAPASPPALPPGEKSPKGADTL